MDNNKRKALLVTELRKLTGLHELYLSESFQTTLKPYLEKLSTLTFISPRDYKSQEEFDFALKSENATAGAYKQLLGFLESLGGRVMDIKKQLEAIEKQEEV